jgi:PAS domain S-box-containing protein
MTKVKRPVKGKSKAECDAKNNARDLKRAQLETANRHQKRETEQRKRTEQSLLESEARLRFLVEQVKDYAILMLDLDGRVVSWNKDAERIKGYRMDEIVGQTMARFYTPEDIRRGLPRQLLKVAEAEGRVGDKGWRIRKDGTRFWADVVITALRDNNGILRGFAKVTRDLTERKQADKALRASEQKFRAVGETALDGIVSADARGKIIYFNPAAQRIFGYSPDEVINKPLTLLMPERFHQAHRNGFERFLSTEEAHVIGKTLELVGRRKDGMEFPLELSLANWKTEDGIFFTAMMRDITVQKTLAEQLRTKNEELQAQNCRIEEATRAKSEFLANMSHELRTPLNGIMGFAEIMHDGKVGPISPQHREYLEDILNSGRHLLQLINDVLDLSKVEAGKMEFKPEPVVPELIVREVCNIVRTLAAQKRIRLTTAVDPALIRMVADARSLKQILYNYLSNAIKFTPDEGTVTVRLKTEDQDHFRIEVEDNGIGIKPEDLNRLFLEFQQLDFSPAKKYSGTGLGLVLTKRIVEAQQGMVGVKSTPGQGSLFYAVLPWISGVAGELMDEEKSAVTLSATPLILVVEDDAKDRAWLALELSRAGYSVEPVATGAEALIRCRDKRFDAIMLDLMLPDMSGRAVLGGIRERGLNLDTPVIIVTVLAHKGIWTGYEVKEILPKPVSPDEILRALRVCGVEPRNREPILVVDDDESALKLADKTLRELGYRPLCSQDVASALRAASTERPAAVVLDLVIPESNGFEFLQHFRKTSEGRRTPVIVWTAKDLTDAERRHLQSAADSIVVKSDMTDELLREIKNCFHRRP